MIYGWGLVGLCYSLSQLTPFKASLLRESWFDEQISFQPHAIFAYLSFFLFIPLAYTLVRAELLSHLRRAMQISALISMTVFVLYPTTVASPDITTTGLASNLLVFLRQWDSPQNCLPSLHAALTLIATWAICHGQTKRRRLHVIVAMIWACLMVLSIIQVRRHLAIDVIAGLLVGGLAAFLSRRFK
jgi:membrane-associated phospholipid phosphatase